MWYTCELAEGLPEGAEDGGAGVRGPAEHPVHERERPVPHSHWPAHTEGNSCGWFLVYGF